MSDWPTVREYEHAGYKVRIVAEEYVDEHYNPRTFDGNVVELHAYHSRYTLGDEDCVLPSDGLPTITCPMCEGDPENTLEGPAIRNDYGIEHPPVCQRCEGFDEVEPTVDEWLASIGAIAAAPLFLYDHSGITISSGRVTFMGEDRLSRDDTRSSDRFMGDSAGWDTSFIGFAVVTKDGAELLSDQEPETIEKAIDSEVECYDWYLTGDCGGWIVGDLDEDGDDHRDSCWGYLNLDDPYIDQCAKEAAERLRDEDQRETNERREMAARDIVTEGA